MLENENIKTQTKHRQREAKSVMKKIMITTALLLMMLSMTVSAYSSRSYCPDRCCAAGCNDRKYNKSSYCSEHKCVIYDCKNKRGSDGMYCTTHHNQYYHVMKNHYSGKSSSGSRYGNSGSKSSSSRSGSSSKSKRSTFDPDDHDIEAYYDDNRDEFDDYEDAYDAFLDDEDAWDDY